MYLRGVFTNNQPSLIELPITYRISHHSANNVTANTSIETTSSKPSSSSSFATASSKFAATRTRGRSHLCQYRRHRRHSHPPESIRTIASPYTCDTTPTRLAPHRRTTTPLHRCNFPVDRPHPRRPRPRRAPPRHRSHPHRRHRTGTPETRSLAMLQRTGHHYRAVATRSVLSMCPSTSSAMRTPDGPSRRGVS